MASAPYFKMINQYFKRRNLRYNTKLKLRARELRNEMTTAEKKLWFEYFRQISYKVYRQKPIGNYIVDFYIPQIKLVIEVDGETHMRDAEYDENRIRELEKLGLGGGKCKMQIPPTLPCQGGNKLLYNFFIFS